MAQLALNLTAWPLRFAISPGVTDACKCLMDVQLDQPFLEPGHALLAGLCTRILREEP